MPHQPDSSDPLAWHKYFAMEGNNKAWELAAKTTRSSTEDSEMLDAAHAAASHWRAVGTDLHIARAELLLAAVHALMGFSNTAWPLACKVKEFFDNQEPADWEVAYIHLIHAHAASISGHEAEFRSSYAQASLALGQIADAEDRKIVQASFDQVAVPE